MLSPTRSMLFHMPSPEIATGTLCRPYDPRQWDDHLGQFLKKKSSDTSPPKNPHTPRKKKTCPWKFEKPYPPGNDHISHLGKLGKSSTQKCQNGTGYFSSKRRVLEDEIVLKRDLAIWHPKISGVYPFFEYFRGVKPDFFGCIQQLYVP